MEFFLFLLIVGTIGAVYVASKRAQERSRSNEERIANVRVEIQATRSALLRRVSLLEEKLQGQRVAEAPAAAAPAEEAPAKESAPAKAAAPPPFPAAPATPKAPPVPPQPQEPPQQAPPGGQPPEAPPPVSGGVDWEQWIGIRGAAVLGAIVLALAAVMFLRYAIEHGLIPPIVRVAIGLSVGLGAIAFAETLRKREYATTANALAGGGIVILYVSVWSARVLYELIGGGLAYVLMILITVTCGLLSWRHRARDIALLGLVGGFATPILLSTGRDNPIGLFPYVLMLDFGLFTLARRRGWPVLMILALAATAFYEAVWIFDRMGPDRVFLGLGVLGLFGVFFAVAGRLQAAGDDEAGQASGQTASWRLTQLAGVLLPFAFALYFAGNADLGPHLYPVAALLLLLLAAAAWMGRVQELPVLPTAAAAATAGVVAVWFMRTQFDDALAWEATAVCFALALAPHVFLERDLRAGKQGNLWVGEWPAWITSLGFLLLLVLFCVEPSSPSLWPWLCGWVVLAGLGLRQATATGHGRIQALVACALGVGLSIFFLDHGRTSTFPSPALYFAIVVLVALGLQTLALAPREAKAKRAADVAAATLPLTLLLFLIGEAINPHLAPGLFLVTTIVLAFLAALSATRMQSGGVYLAAVLLLAVNHWLGTMSYPWTAEPADAALSAFLIQLIPVLVFSFWPLLVGGVFRQSRWAWYGAALAGPLWFVALRLLFEVRFGDAAIGLLPVALGALSLAAAYQARQLGLPGDPARLRSLVWFSAVALGFLSVAIPLQLEKQWVTLGWALQGFCRDRPLETTRPRWTEVLRPCSVGGCDDPPGGQPRPALLLPAVRLAHRQLADVHLSRPRRGSVGGRLDSPRVGTGAAQKLGRGSLRAQVPRGRDRLRNRRDCRRIRVD